MYSFNCFTMIYMIAYCSSLFHYFLLVCFLVEIPFLLVYTYHPLLISLLYLVSGNFTLPIKCLEPPPEEWLVRGCSKSIVDQLKQEMVDHTCTDVQPILCVIKLKKDETFNYLMEEGYKYYTIGGNHSC